MLFNSLEFLFGFFPLFLGLYFLCPWRMGKNLIILVFSLFFYAWSEPKNILVMLMTIALTYVLALFAHRRKGILVLYLVCVLSSLFYFKYAGFLVNDILHLNQVIRTTLPIGISFYTFQCISYVVDVYTGKVKAQKNPILVGTYVALFPQLIAGPIVRYSTIEDELMHRQESLSGINHGFRRFALGVCKKILLANNLAIMADAVFNFDVHLLSLSVSWIGAIAYALQIYFDFSGYSDMAIGIGEMLGFHFLENFNYPYAADSATDFWRRWHMSLGSFFKDYVYIPLGGNRVSSFRWIFNILTVWFLTGLWHGANYTFIAWGLYFGFWLIMEKKYLLAYLKKHKLLSHPYALLIILGGWVLFRGNSLGHALYYLKAMLDVRHLINLKLIVKLDLLKNVGYIPMGIVLSIPYIGKRIHALEEKASLFYDLLLLAGLLVSISFLVNNSYNPFIYFRF